MYVEVSELKNVLAAVDTDQDDDYRGTAAELSETLLDIVLEDAQAQVDSTLNKLYTTPFSDPPKLIKAITRAIAAFNADITYRKSTSYTAVDSNPLYIRYKWALDTLEQLRTSKIDLNYSLEGGSMVFHVYEPQLFDMREMLQPPWEYRGDW